MTDPGLDAVRAWLKGASRELGDLEATAFAIVRRRQLYVLEGGQERRQRASGPACHDCPQNRRGK